MSCCAVTLQIQCSTMDSADSVSHEPSPLGCNICIEPAIEPVITTCGHMYCWPCLYKWLYVEPTRGCPVCRTRVTLNVNIIPFYSMQDLPIPEQRINHANDSTFAVAIPPRPTAPTFQRGEESIEEYQAESPQVGAVGRALDTEERYQDEINRLWNVLQFSEMGRHRVDQAFNQMRRERDELWRETLQVRSSLRYWQQQYHRVVRVVRDLRNIVRHHLLDAVRLLRAANQARQHHIMAMAEAPRHI